MDISERRFIHGLPFFLGIILMIGGIFTRTQGASTIGLIVAAINFQQWQRWNEQGLISDKESLKLFLLRWPHTRISGRLLRCARNDSLIK